MHQSCADIEAKYKSKLAYGPIILTLSEIVPNIIEFCPYLMPFEYLARIHEDWTALRDFAMDGRIVAEIGNRILEPCSRAPDYEHFHSIIFRFFEHRIISEVRLFGKCIWMLEMKAALPLAPIYHDGKLVSASGWEDWFLPNQSKEGRMFSLIIENDQEVFYDCAASGLYG